jgi:hypothetical protein
MEVPTLNARHPRAEEETAPWLVPHQQAALHAMAALEAGCKGVVIDEFTSMCTEVGVLGDKPGSGKTFIIGALVNRTGEIPHEKTSVTELLSRAHVRTRRVLRPIDTTIIVVPHNITRHWAQHLRRFDWVTLHVLRAADVDVAKHMLVHEPPRALLVSASVFKPVMEFMRQERITVKRMVIDEADTVRLVGIVLCGHQAAAFYWLVTASAHNLLPGSAVDNSFTVAHARAPQHTATYGARANVESVLVRDLIHVSHSANLRDLARILLIPYAAIP